MEIGKYFRFEAAHRLLGWKSDHPCYEMHGHSYKVLVVVEGHTDRVPGYPGAVMDFGAISSLWKSIVHERLDHQYLNHVLEMENTTAENLAVWIWNQLEPFIGGLKAIEVWETETAYARYQPHDTSL